MTKSTTTREESVQAAFDLKVGYTLGITDIEIIKRVARMALSAMGSEAKEPISFDEWSRKCALQITLCYPDFREKAQYIWDSARETQQPAPEYPEVLPCSVLLEPGMRFGKGVKTRLVLEAIQRRAEHHAELEAMAPEERAEYDANIEAFKAMLPQPAPVVSAELLHTAASAIEDLLTTKDRTGAFVWFDLPFRLRSAANAQPVTVVPDDVRQALSKMDDEIIA